MKLYKNQSIQSIALIARENPRAVALTCICLFLASFLDAVGISAIFPLISVVLDTHAQLPESRLTDFITAISVYGPYTLSLIVMGCFILKAIVLYFAMSVVARQVALFSHKLRVSFVQSILQAQIRFTLSKSLGENLAVLSDGSVRAAAAYISAARILSGIFQITLYFAYAMWLSVEATLISMVTGAILMLLIRSTMNRTRRAGAHTTKYIQDISRNMGEALRGIKEAKATAREDYLSSYIFDGSEKLRAAHVTNLVVGQTLRNIQDPVTIASALVCLLVFKDVLQLEAGYILFILAVYYRLMTALNLTLGDYQKFIGQEAALWAIKDGITAAENEREIIKPDGIKPEQTPQTISFDHVSMHYGDKVIFRDISFSLPAYRMSLLKGESGRGKTTCIDIICKLVEPSSGKIMIGDANLSSIDTHLWRQNIGYVDQFPFLFKGSIRDNILLGNTAISDDQLKETLRLCHINKFVDAQPEGLDFQIQEGGTNISGGQRQRLAIARSVIRQPHYLIMDEPTSALDQESTDAIFQTLKDLSHTMSVIMISHSETAETFADHIVDFDKL